VLETVFVCPALIRVASSSGSEGLFGPDEEGLVPLDFAEFLEELIDLASTHTRNVKFVAQLIV
jgi:hypothetical protein